MESREHSRSDQRKPPRNQRVAWRYRCGQPLRRALVRDESKSGIGLILEGSDMPSAGWIIQVSSAENPVFRDAHVIRTTNDPFATAHVGCRWKGVRATAGWR